MTPQELDKLAKVCRKHGITQFTADGVTLVFSLTHEAPSPTVQASPEATPPSKPLSEEDILFFSSGN